MLVALLMECYQMLTEGQEEEQIYVNMKQGCAVYTMSRATGYSTQNLKKTFIYHE